jgi:hypothetical protein
MFRRNNMTKEKNKQTEMMQLKSYIIVMLKMIRRLLLNWKKFKLIMT